MLCALSIFLIVSNKNNKHILVVYNPAQNTKTTYKVNNGDKFSKYLTASEQNSLGYFLDSDYSLKVNLEDLITGNITIYKGEIINLSGNNLNSKAAGVHYTGKADSTIIQTLVEKYVYVDFSDAEIEGEFPQLNNKLTDLILSKKETITGINNFSNLKNVKVNSENIINCFNNCPKLQSVTINGLKNLQSSLNKLISLKNINLGGDLITLEDSLIGCPELSISTTSENFLVEKGVLYQKDGTNLNLVKAFNVNENLQLNPNTTVIKNSAFSDLSSAVDIEIGSNITTVNDYAFYGSGIKSIKIIDSRVLTIGKYAFADCRNLQVVSLGNAVKVIDDGAFSGSAVAELDFSNSILSDIGSSAFKDCNNLQKVSFNPNNLVNISKRAFYNCFALKTITGLNTKIINEETFYNCSNLSNINPISSLLTIQKRGFYNCGLTNLEFALQVNTIYEEAFAYSKQLQKVELFNLTQVYKNAFYNCAALCTFKNLGNLTIFEECLTNCPISEINIVGDNLLVEGNAVYNAAKTALLYYAIASDKTSYTLPKSVNAIGQGAEGAGSINAYVLSSATNLTEILVEDGNIMFSSNDGILCYNNSILVSYPSVKTGTEYTIPKEIKIIGKYAFVNCPNLITLNILDSVTEIYNAAFYNLKSLKLFNSPFVGQTCNDMNTAFIGYVFGAKNQMLNNMYLPKTLTNVVITKQSQFLNSAFFDCVNLTSVTLNNCDILTASMFNGCNNLKYLNIQKPLISINKLALNDCYSLSILTINYNPELFVSSDALNGISRSVTVLLSGSKGITPSDYSSYRSKFNVLGWTWRTL